MATTPCPRSPTSRARNREGELYDVAARRTSALLRVRPPLSAARRRGRRLQGALQPGRPAARAVGLRRRRAVRSDREEAVLPRLSGRARLQLRHARLRPALRVLPELGDVAGAARSGGRRAAARRVARAIWSRDALRLRARASSSAPTTSRSSRASGRWPSSRKRRAAGLATGFVSNGNGTPEVLEYLRPWVDLYKVDLKSFDDRRYRELGGRLEPILDTIRRLHAMGVWVEIVTLLIPGLQRLARRAAAADGVRRGRVARHPVARHGVSWRLQDDRARTTRRADMLLEAADIGRAAGLRYVYAGNLPGAVGDLENTRCAACGETLVERRGYRIRATASRRTAAARPAARRCPAAGAPRRQTPRAVPPAHRGLRISNSDSVHNPRLCIPSTASGARCATCGCRSPTAATCAANTACRRTTTSGCRARTCCTSRRSAPLVDVFLGARRRQGAADRRRTAAAPRPAGARAHARRASPGCSDLALTTNGVLLADQADALKAAGLAPRSPSASTRCSPDRFMALTRFDELDRGPRGIDAAAPRLRPPQDRHGRHPRRERR